MPIPFLLGALAVGAGLFGIATACDASEKNSRARELLDNAQYNYNEAKQQMEQTREMVSHKLEILGECKVKVWSNNIGGFLSTFKKFKNVKIENHVNIDRDDVIKQIDITELQNMEVAAMKAKEIMTAGIGALGAGALAGIAAYGGVMMFASASTGTAITALSGVAATNAALAWLGGGTLAAGGLGVAGGAAVLGGVVLAPLLAVGGLFASVKADENLAKAQRDAAKANEATEKMRTMSMFLNNISEIAGNYTTFIERFSDECTKACIDMQNVYEEAYEKQKNYFFNRIRSFFGMEIKIDFDELDEKEQRVLHLNWQMIQILYGVLKAPILTQNGNIHDNAVTTIESARDAVALLPSMP